MRKDKKTNFTELKKEYENLLYSSKHNFSSATMYFSVLIYTFVYSKKRERGKKASGLKSEYRIRRSEIGLDLDPTLQIADPNF